MSYSADFKKILVPLDLTDASSALLAYAARLARQTSASLDLLFVWEPPRFIAPDLAMAPAAWATGDLEAMALKNAQARIETLRQKVDSPGLQVRVAVRLGFPTNGILDYAENERVDLIVMGTHGRSGLERLFLGSVAQRVVAGAPCPVLTVNAYAMKHPSPSLREGR